MINLSYETEALAQRIAVLRRVSIEQAIQLALEETARSEGISVESGYRRDSSPEAIHARRKRIDEIVNEVAALPILDPRPVEQIIDDINDL